MSVFYESDFCTKKTHVRTRFRSKKGTTLLRNAASAIVVLARSTSETIVGKIERGRGKNKSNFEILFYFFIF
jgi:hypothetical protein